MKTKKMNKKAIKILAVLCLTTFISCSKDNSIAENKADLERKVEKQIALQNSKGPGWNCPDFKKKKEPHRYGGWYCPDNLNGFPAVDIVDWKKTPIVNGRMATKEETQNGTALIFVDMEKYPNAKPLDIEMPKMASIYNQSSRREEFIIIIQALNIDNDSIVGFRYLNGGNGSARLNEVKLLSENEIAMIPDARFVSHNIKIKATQTEIWHILTKLESLETLQPIFDEENELKINWRKTANVNFHYSNSGNSTASFANILYGCYYVQNDYDYTKYSEKFLLLEDEDTKETELKIVTGPYGDDYEDQKEVVKNWAQKVKELSEKE